MEPEFIGTYCLSGTNGKIQYGDRLITYRIELPRKDNHTRVSCIPDGRYELIKRCFARRSLGEGWQVKDVPQRKDILIYPANDASAERKGCIALLSFLSGVGKGLRSRQAMDTLVSLVYKAPELPDRVFLNVKSDAYDFG